jgi:hypothetical protein
LLANSIWLWEGYAETVRRFQFCRLQYLGGFRVARNGVQTNQGVQVRMHLSSFILLNTFGTTSERLESTRKSKMDKGKKEKQKWASSEQHQHSTMELLVKEKREANLDPREVSICVLPNSEVKTVADEKQRNQDIRKKGKRSMRKRHLIIHHVQKNRNLLRTGGFAQNARNCHVSSSSGRKS